MAAPGDLFARRLARVPERVGVAGAVGRRRQGPQGRERGRAPSPSYVCPFTINGRASQVFANVDGLVGFEVGDLQTGLILDRVVIEGYQMEVAEKFECPSHGIGLTPDERELWVADGVDNRLHVFDATTYPPVASTTIEVRAQPRWVTFGIDGRYAYPSTGDVIDRESKKVVATLEDERRLFVHSERMLEIQFAGRDPIRAGDQAAAGQKLENPCPFAERIDSVSSPTYCSHLRNFVSNVTQVL